MFGPLQDHHAGVTRGDVHDGRALARDAASELAASSEIRIAHSDEHSGRAVACGRIARAAATSAGPLNSCAPTGAGSAPRGSEQGETVRPTAWAEHNSDNLRGLRP
jgi:hypothetical protein